MKDMKTKEEIIEAIENFEGDKRSKEYKALKAYLNGYKAIEEENKELTERPYSKEYYEEIKSWTGYIKDGKKFFKTYNEVFNKNYQLCNCPLKIRKMVIQMKKIQEKWERENK